MHRPFFTLGAAIRDLAKFAAPLVCPDAGTPAAKTSEWAKTALNFLPSPKQVEVLDIDAKYLILCCNRQWGKTTTIAIKALHRALTIKDQNIVIISRTKLQAGILIDRACNFAARLGHKIRRVLGHQFSLKLPNGSNIFAVPHTSDTSLGNTANVLIVDEAALVKDEVYFSVSPFVGRTHGAIWLMSTPRRQAGFFYNIWHGEDKRWHKIFSTVKDCPEIDPDFLDMQRRADEIKYKQDFECEFLQPPDRLFSVKLIQSMHED
ncbi:MAG: terminase large subunit domain-containing protein [Bryobacteraceae bacterium]